MPENAEFGVQMGSEWIEKLHKKHVVFSGCNTDCSHGVL